MPDVLVAATVLSLLFAVLMTVIAAKLLRDSRTRTTTRVEALQALASSQVIGFSGAQVLGIEQGSEASFQTAELEPLPTHVPERPRTHFLENLGTREAEHPIQAQHPIQAEHAITREPENLDLVLRDEPATLPAPARVPRGDVPVFHRPTSDRLWKTGTSPIAAPIAEHELFEAAIPPTPSRRWTGVAAVALVMTLGGGTFYLISSGVIARALARHEANVATTATLPIELLSLRYTTDGGNFVVTGLVQNPTTSVSLRGVQAVVYLFDAEGKFIASARASLENGVLSPGGESGFVVRIPAGTAVTKYRVSFQHEDGAAVQHVDHRGTLPENTTGDAIQPPPAAAPVIRARKNG